MEQEQQESPALALQLPALEQEVLQARAALPLREPLEDVVEQRPQQAQSLLACSGRLL